MTLPQNLPPPSRNPTDDDSLLGVFNIVLQKFLQGVDDMLPAIVIAANRGAGTAQVQPLISILITDQTIVQRAPILSVPIQQVGAGGFMSNFPIKPGNLGFLKANDRDISLFKQSFQISIPNTSRKHSFADAVFMPMVMTGFSIADGDADNYVLGTIDGSMRLSMSPTCVTITDDATYTAAAAAVLDVQSRSRAFKFPVMTQTQKNAISPPQPGFAVFDSTLNRLSVYSTGTGWS